MLRWKNPIGIQYSFIIEESFALINCCMLLEIIHYFSRTVFGLAYINSQIKNDLKQYKIRIWSELRCFICILWYHDIIHILLKLENKSKTIIKHKRKQVTKIKDWNREKSPKGRVGTKTNRVMDRSSSQLNLHSCFHLLASSPYKIEP